MQRALVLLVVLAAAGGASCGSGPRQGTTPTAPPSPAVAKFPVVAKVPAHASYVGAFARLDQATTFLRDSVRPFESPEVVDDFFRRRLGLSPIDPADLAEHGFALDRGVAMFSTGLMPTFVIPISDAAKVTAALERILRDETVLVREHRGLRVTSTKTDDIGLAWAIQGDWLVVHVTAPQVEKALDWLDEIVDATAGAAVEDFAWALERAGSDAGAVGVIRVQLLLDAMKLIDPIIAGPDAKERCQEAYARLDGTFGRVAVYGSMGEGSVTGGAFIELAEATHATLSRRVAGPPEKGYLAHRKDAAIALDLAVDIDWLASLGRDEGASCGLASELIDELDLTQLSNPIPGVTSYHVALLDLRQVGSSIDLGVMGWLGVGDEGRVRKWIDLRIPRMAQLAMRTREVGGVEVKEIPLDLVGINGSAGWALGNGSLRFAVGRGVMEKLLGDASAAGGDSRELAALLVQPDKMPDLEPLADLLTNAVGLSGWEAKALVTALSAFRMIQLTATLETGGVRVVGGFSLR